MHTPTPENPVTCVDLILHADWVVPMQNANTPWITQGSVVIHQQKILAVCSQQQALQQYHGAQEIHLPGQALLPGFINGHGHAAMTLLRGYADDTSLHTWLNEHIWPAEQRHVGIDFVQTGSELALAEMLLAGITCFSDMYFFPDVTASLAAKIGIRAQINPPILEFPSAWAQQADEYIAKAQQLHADFKQHSRIHIGFGPHAPYTVGNAALEKIIDLAEQHQTFIQMHIHETTNEVAEAIKTQGQRPLARLKQLGLLSSRLQAVHMTQLLPEEIDWLAESGSSVIHCPHSNLKLASGFCPLTELLAAHIPVALGTDGAASNNALSILSEARTAALLAKGLTQQAQVVPAWQALNICTGYGAKALGLDQRIGKLQPGYQADCIAMDLTALSTQPVFNPLSAIMYAAHTQQVSHVWVDGQLLVKNRQLQTLDADAIRAKTQHWQQKIGGKLSTPRG